MVGFLVSWILGFLISWLFGGVLITLPGHFGDSESRMTKLFGLTKYINDVNKH